MAVPLTSTLERLHAVLDGMPARVVACSGGVDSLVLAAVAHRAAPSETLVAHAVSPAVPGAATARTVAIAAREGWRLELVRTGEFDDERYLGNPTDRCYFCKQHLYGTLTELAARLGRHGGPVLSGANLDDLDEYRPGLRAAGELGVRHPFIEASLRKCDIRDIARHFVPDAADLAASPCLASRLYTGTRVTAARLHAIEVGEELIRHSTGVSVVRCRLRDGDVTVEVGDEDRPAITGELLGRLRVAMRAVEPAIAIVRLDDRPYRPGRAILVAG